MYECTVIKLRFDHNLRERNDDDNLNRFRGLTIVLIRTIINSERTVHSYILTDAYEHKFISKFSHHIYINIFKLINSKRC